MRAHGVTEAQGSTLAQFERIAGQFPSSGSSPRPRAATADG
jgi:hypothetical protein